MKNERIRSLTEGAMIGAMYGVILILIRFLITSADAFIYYVLPVPMMIYTVKRGFKDGFILLCALIGLSFLIVTDPYYVLPLLIPNFIIGYIGGILEKYTKLKLTTYVIVFSTCLAADYLSIWAYGKITGINYFDDIYLFESWFNENFGITHELYDTVVSLCIPIVMVVDSICKLVFIYALYDIIVRRLKIKDDITRENVLRLKYNKWISISYIIIFILSIPFIGMLAVNNTLIIKVIAGIFMGVLTLLSFYLIYQYIFYIALYMTSINKKGLGIFLAILGFVFFPIGIIGGLISNFIKL